VVWVHSDSRVMGEIMAFLKEHAASGMSNRDCGWSTVFVHCDSADEVKKVIAERWGTASGFSIEDRNAEQDAPDGRG